LKSVPKVFPVAEPVLAGQGIIAGACHFENVVSGRFNARTNQQVTVSTYLNKLIFQSN